MPQFILNDHPAPRAYDELSTFAKSYVEAMFFTNCDTGEDDEDKANRLGVSRLTTRSLQRIAADCAQFQTIAAPIIARVLEHGQRDEEGIAHDLWFTRQGHGVGFWEGESRGYPDDTGDTLSTLAKGMGEVYPCFAYGWIHYE